MFDEEESETSTESVENISEGTDEGTNDDKSTNEGTDDDKNTSEGTDEDQEVYNVRILAFNLVYTTTFKVKEIVSHKKQSGKYFYRVRWDGFDKSDDT